VTCGVAWFARGAGLGGPAGPAGGRRPAAVPSTLGSCGGRRRLVLGVGRRRR